MRWRLAASQAMEEEKKKTEVKWQAEAFQHKRFALRQLG